MTGSCRQFAEGVRVLVLTDRGLAAGAGRSLPDTVAAALGGVPAGSAAVVFREKDLAPAERLALGRDVAAALRDAAGVMIVASDVTLARQLGAAGVHLAAADPWPVSAESDKLVVGRSCHDAREVAAAVTEGTGYVTVSPVYLTASKPGYGPALGPDGLRNLVRDAAGGMPVFALGGVDDGRVAACLDAGAAGVAVMGAVMAAPDPAEALNALVDAATAGSRP